MNHLAVRIVRIAACREAGGSGIVPAPVAALAGGFDAMQSTHNWHIQATRPIITPRLLAESLPLTAEVTKTVVSGRHAVQNILDGKDRRLQIGRAHV